MQKNETPMRCVALITARKGSKRLPNKNVMPLGGQPLVAWSARAALASQRVTEAFVSTDCSKIAEICAAEGVQVPFLRPPELSDDIATNLDVIRHFLAWYEEQYNKPAHYLCLLQATSPFRTAQDIDHIIDCIDMTLLDSAFSVCKTSDLQGSYRLTNDNVAQLATGKLAAQRLLADGKLYSPNGALYVVRPETLSQRDTLLSQSPYAYVMGAAQSIDIDTWEDFTLAQDALKMGNNPPHLAPPEITIAGQRIGSQHPPVFWPDIDVYFRRDEGVAIDLIDQIARNGCTFLKAAILHRADLCLPGDQQISYFDKASARIITEPYFDVISRLVTPLDMMRRLFEHAKQRGLKLVVSVYDQEGIDFSLEQQVVALKIPSSNITHKHLIESAASTSLPMVLDTGRSSMDEIDRAVEWAKNAGAEGRLLIQHSPPGPPTTPDRYDMRMLEGLSARYFCPVGLSDHSQSLSMFPIAITMGAGVIEKGLTANNIGPEIDTAHALQIKDLGAALTCIEQTWQALGNKYRTSPADKGTPIDRMGCIALQNIKMGQKLCLDDIGFAFPPIGIGAENISQVIGSVATEDITKGAVVHWRSVALQDQSL